MIIADAINDMLDEVNDYGAKERAQR